nr:MAG TPA: ATP synthase subunit 9 [Caudoviricetes sp.]
MRKPTISDIALVLAIVNLLWIVFCEFILPRVT